MLLSSTVCCVSWQRLSDDLRDRSSLAAHDASRGSVEAGLPPSAATSDVCEEASSRTHAAVSAAVAEAERKTQTREGGAGAAGAVGLEFQAA